MVAGWRFTPPPRASVAPVAAPLSIHIHTDAAMFQVLVSPGKVGANDFVLQLMTGDAALLPAKEATLILSLPERGIEPMERRATLGPDGYWHVRGVALPLPGRWRMQIDALVTDFQKITLQDELRCGDCGSCRIGRAQRNPSFLARRLMGIAALHPSYETVPKWASNPRFQRLFTLPGLVFSHPIRFHCTSSGIPLIP